MILHGEIRDLEVEWALREDVIEKDYVIGWLLWGIGSHEVLRSKWVFKGGTCLKKCWFETYRFSEDLDFTVLPDGPLDPGEILPILDDILARIHEESGIDFSVQERRARPRPTAGAVEGRIYYRGPRMAPSPASVKLDLTQQESVVRPPLTRIISHPFSDGFPSDGGILCYSFAELFAEKIRALGERCRPRDLYDVISIYRHADLRGEPSEVRQVLVEKCESKRVPLPTYDAIRNAPAATDLEAEWENMLAHQLPELPPHGLYWEALSEFFDWLEERVSEVPLAPSPRQPSEDPSWTPPRTVSVWRQGVPLERVRFAGANRLCITINYRKESGERVRRTIEPYSLRRTKDGHLLLHAFDLHRRAHRAFRVDRLLGVEVTTTPFRPRYQVEFA